MFFPVGLSAIRHARFSLHLFSVLDNPFLSPQKISEKALANAHGSDNCYCQFVDCFDE